MTGSPSPLKPRIFFPHLDGLRFISFFVVFLFHSYKTTFNYLQTTDPGMYAALKFLFQHGSLGVNFFFVLSGFLITYLLVKERELTGTIHVGKFYVRRVLRIWPLYYLCLAIGFILFPIIKQAAGEVVQESANPWYYIFFAANFDYLRMYPDAPNALLLIVLWSVAVEEQFYLTWPIILRFLPVKAYRFVFPAIILGSLMFRSFYTGSTDHDYAVRNYHTYAVIGDMALGGWLAYCSVFSVRFMEWIRELKKPFIFGIYAGAVMVCLFKDYLFPPGIPVVFERLVIGIFFALIIAEQNYAKHSLFKMGQLRLLSKLGTYTYGLYCLHWLGLYVALKVIIKTGLNQQLATTAAVEVILALVLSVCISLFTYHVYEKWFLRLKDKFAFITR